MADLISIEGGQAEVLKNGASDYEGKILRMGYRFRLNTLTFESEVSVDGGDYEPMSDRVEHEILCRLYDIGYGRIRVAQSAMSFMASKHPMHPVKHYLESMKWDGEDRILAMSSFFSDNHQKVGEMSFFHAMVRRWLIGAVGKVYNPVMFQNPILVIDGAQGAGKSYWAQWICPLPKLFIERPIDTKDKDHLGYLASSLVWEVPEIESTTGTQEINALKHFLTMKEVKWRPAYAKYSISRPSMASFIGTMNNISGFLDDPTGNRRFRPVALESIDRNYSKIDKDQIWAQAYSLYLAGETHNLSDEESVVMASSQEAFEVEDPVAEKLMEIYRFKKGGVIPSKEFREFLPDEQPKKIAKALRRMGGKPAKKAGIRVWLDLEPVSFAR